jgi:4-hydroxy-2-oxoheptanedioate aldolase
VQDTIRDALQRNAAAGKAPGIMSLGDKTPAYLDAGAKFLAVGIDVVLLVKGARAMVAKWQGA